MNRHADIKKAVLRGVYEDNAGIPRSVHRSGRSGIVTPPPPPPRPGYRGRAMLAVLLGLVALFGINFRLVTIDGSGPVAMQVPQTRPRQSPTIPMPVLTGRIDGLSFDL